MRSAWRTSLDEEIERDGLAATSGANCANHLQVLEQDVARITSGP
jgi:hypothetical protein